MKLERCSIVDLIVLCSNAREDEILQYEALIGAWDWEEAATAFINRPGLKFTLCDNDGKPIVAGGWEEVISGVWQSWMVGTDENWDTHWRSITKYSRRVMDELLASGARRLQTMALTSRTKAHEWYIRGLKMEPESVCRNFGLAGEDVSTFVRLERKNG